MFDNLYENIGAKIKNLSKWIFIIVAIGGTSLFVDRTYSNASEYYVAFVM